MNHHLLFATLVIIIILNHSLKGTSTNTINNNEHD